MVYKTYLLWVSFLLINQLYSSDRPGLFSGHGGAVDDSASVRSFFSHSVAGRNRPDILSVPESSLIAYLIACEKTKQARLKFKTAQVKLEAAKLNSGRAGEAGAGIGIMTGTSFPEGDRPVMAGLASPRVNLLAREQPYADLEQPDLGQKIMEKIGNSPRVFFVTGLLAGACLHAGTAYLGVHPALIKKNS